MKLLSSSLSPLSSSSSTISLDVIMCNSKSSTAGCLAGIFRRILCSGTLPTHPSDHITEETNSVNSCQYLEDQAKILSLETPGIVARLMGLESMPDVDFDCVKPRPNSISRSWSMNSTDRLAGYCDSKQQGQHHRPAKSTTSFRETAEFVELGNEEFFILSFENVSKDKEFRPKARKCGAGYGELKQRRTGRVRKAENIAEKAATTMTTTKYNQEGKRNVSSDLNRKESCSDKRINKVGNNVKFKDSKTSSVSTKTCTRKQNVAGSEAMKSRIPEKTDQVYLPSNGVKPNLNKKKNKKNSKNETDSQAAYPLDSESTSEDSSPVSVLDCGPFLLDPLVSISEEDCGLTTTTSSRRKLSLEVDNYERLSPRRDSNLMSEEGKTEAKSRKKRTSEGQECSQVLDEICRLSEAELFGSSNWFPQRWSLDNEEFQSIGEELELQIFGQLVEEVVLLDQS